MKAYKISSDWKEDEIVVAESMEEVTAEDGQEIEELCEVLPACACGFRVWEKGHDCPTAPEYILEDGTTYDMYGMEQVQEFGELDIAKTDENKEDGECDFSEWAFDLWVGSYWDGSNWKIVVVEK